MNKAPTPSTNSMADDIKLKIHDGTGRLTGKPLCMSCTHRIQRGEDIWCNLYGGGLMITKPIYYCNKYYSTNMPSLRDLETIAWELKSKGGRIIGFHPPDSHR